MRPSSGSRRGSAHIEESVIQMVTLMAASRTSIAEVTPVQETVSKESMTLSNASSSSPEAPPDPGNLEASVPALSLKGDESPSVLVFPESSIRPSDLPTLASDTVSNLRSLGSSDSSLRENSVGPSPMRRTSITQVLLEANIPVSRESSMHDDAEDLGDEDNLRNYRLRAPNSPKVRPALGVTDDVEIIQDELEILEKVSNGNTVVLGGLEEVQIVEILRATTNFRAKPVNLNQRSTSGRSIDFHSPPSSPVVSPQFSDRNGAVFSTSDASPKLSASRRSQMSRRLTSFLPASPFWGGSPHEVPEHSSFYSH